MLSDKEEALLSKASEVFQGANKTFNLLNNADIKFDEITTEDGEKVELTNGNYSVYIESKTKMFVRKHSETLYKPYINLKNTFASTLGTEVKGHNFSALVHNYDSARQAALASNQVPEEVYDALVEVVNEKLPLLHRYTALQQKH